MSMPLSYKDLREELDEILWHFRVPRALFFRLLDLRNYLTNKIEIHCAEDNEKIMRALEIVEEIMPRIRKNNEIYEKTIF